MTTPPAQAPSHEPLTIAAQPDLTGGRRIGVLLSHGFTGSPVSIRPWGEALGARGYGVAVPRLPGHGTRWQDLNALRFDDWYGEVARVFDQLCLDHDAVVVGGLSMGGSLALKLAEDHPDRVSGLVMVNPALATKRLDVKLLPVLKHLVPSFPGIANDIKKEGVQEGGYTRTPLKAIHSFMQAWPTIIGDLPQVTCPVLYFRSSEDHVVDASTRPIVLDGISSTDVTSVDLHESFHVATLDNDAPTIFEQSADFVARVTGAPVL
ncbi:carboxylesterase [Nocardioides sp.]|uniref:alpha/beta hydrolase n=1 Tax=Nocardioides sp. TaxID=35761 RepID=UPI002717AAF2|nr:alpha/beta fold hydrolase [Nocardioides sp.]MDO9455062.1 alpha/beta fold hydrolase [Nocardioides sp.]